MANDRLQTSQVEEMQMLGEYDRVQRQCRARNQNLATLVGQLPFLCVLCVWQKRV